MPAYSRKIEALAEAITAYSGYLKPDSELHQARNPGGLKATSMRHLKDSNGHRIFSSFIDGVQALLFDIKRQLNGESWAELTPEHTLEDLALAYTQPGTASEAWARFLRKALTDTTVSKRTPLSYFIDKDKD